MTQRIHPINGEMLSLIFLQRQLIFSIHRHGAWNALKQLLTLYEHDDVLASRVEIVPDSWAIFHDCELGHDVVVWIEVEGGSLLTLEKLDKYINLWRGRIDPITGNVKFLIMAVDRWGNPTALIDVADLYYNCGCGGSPESWLPEIALQSSGTQLSRRWIR